MSWTESTTAFVPTQLRTSKIKGELPEKKGEGIASVKTLCKDLSVLPVIWSSKREILIGKKAPRQAVQYGASGHLCFGLCDREGFVC